MSAARMRDLAAAEWIKFWSLRSTPAVLAAVTAWCLYSGYRTSQDSYSVWLSIPPGKRDGFDPSGVFRGPEWFILLTVAGSVGALTVAGEHASGLIRTTFTAVPDRPRVAAAKMAVVTAVMTGVGAVIAVAVFAFDAAAMSGHHVSLSPGDPGAVPLLVSTALVVPLSALAGMALGALIRDTAATIAAVCVVFMLLPVLFKNPSTRWAIDLGNALPCYFWGSLTTMGPGHGHVVGDMPSVAAAWTAFAAWPVVSAVVVGVALHRRDV